MEVEDLPSEMVSMLHQSEQFALWVDCGSVPERMNVESIIYVIKRRFNGLNFSRSTQLQNKEKELL